MAEKENMVVNEVPPASQPDENKFLKVLKKIGAGLKEWGRKQIVALKRSPQRIPLIITVITSVLWLIWLFTFSRASYSLQGVSYLGLVVFATTLLSILVLPLFLNAFPKRKRPSVVFIVLVFVFLAVMIVLDILYYSKIYTFLYIEENQSASWIESRPYIGSSLNLAIVHIVLLAISALSLALMPLYTPLIRKINTSKEIAGNDIHEVIDVEDE